MEFEFDPDDFNPPVVKERDGMNARELDRKFDKGEDLEPHVDLSKARRINRKQQS